MQELVYLSYANQNFNKQQLVELLQNAREKNAEIDVTGILLYDGKSMFIQAIEGDKVAVENLFARIQADPRHGSIVTLWRNDIDSRSFPDWKMGFKQIGPSTLGELDGFSDYLSGPTNSNEPDTQHFTRVLLEHFKNKLRYP